MDVFGVTVPLVLIVLALGYRYFTSKFDTFKKLGIPGPKPYPILGTLWPFFTKGILEYDKIMYRNYGRIVGTFRARRPVLFIYDPDILKQILVKDFGSFKNRDVLDLGQYPFDKMLSEITNDHWKRVRNHVSPTFSGHKLRGMMSMINQCSKTLVNNIKMTADMLECKEHSGAFTMDVIASTSFGIDIDSKQDKNNKFVRMARTFITLDEKKIAFLAMIMAPFLMPYLNKVGLGFINKEALDFFVDITEKSIKDREERPDENPSDFLQLMLASRVDEDGSAQNNDAGNTGSKKGLSHDEVLAQCVLFFLAGYDTTANLLSLGMYCMALNPECQERAYQEVVDVLGQNEPTYDDMKNLPYVEMCLSETLRMYSPASRTDRVASEDVTISGVTIPKDMLVIVPVNALHYDPDVWPEPEKFDPERFTPEARQARHEFYYMPFGMGPRNCVAQRLALLEAKVAMVHLLRNFRFVPCEKTQIPLKLKPLKMEGEKGTWVKAELRG